MSSIPCPQRPPVFKNQETNSMVKKSLVVKKPVPSASRSIKIESKMQVAEVAEDVVASPEESREELWSSTNPNIPLRSDSLEESEDQEAEEAEEAEEVVSKSSLSSKKPKKKVSLAQEREQFFVFDALESSGFNDDQMIIILGIKNTIQEQMEKRNAMLESDKFHHFKTWKKLKLKTPKVVSKVAKIAGKKRGRPVGTFMHFNKVQIPENTSDAPWYYQAVGTVKGNPGPEVFRDKAHSELAGYWVDGALQKIEMNDEMNDDDDSSRVSLCIV